MPEITAAAALKQQHPDKIVTTTSISGNGLELTVISTTPDLDALTFRDTSLTTISLDNEIVSYFTEHNHSASSYTITGIDAPFTCTTTYTFPTAGLDVHDILLTTISNDPRASAKILGNPIMSDTSISVTHKYDNAANFSANCFTEFGMVNKLHSEGVTRTITYAMV
jgi:hypothetical protein